MTWAFIILIFILGIKLCIKKDIPEIYPQNIPSSELEDIIYPQNAKNVEKMHLFIILTLQICLFHIFFVTLYRDSKRTT